MHYWSSKGVYGVDVQQIWAFRTKLLLTIAINVYITRRSFLPFTDYREVDPFSRMRGNRTGRVIKAYYFTIEYVHIYK